MLQVQAVIIIVLNFLCVKLCKQKSLERRGLYRFFAE